MEERKTLNQWRVLRGLEVGQLEEKAGVKRIGRFMYDGQQPGVKSALKLAEALGVRVEQIIWEKAEKVDRDKLPPMPKSPPFDPRTMKVSVVSDEQMALVPVFAAAGWTKRDIYTEMGVSHNTFYKALERYEAKHGPIQFVNARTKTPKAAPKPQAAQKAEKGVAKEGGKEKASSRSRKAKMDAV